MDNLEQKIKNDWESLSVPDDKVLDAIKSGMQQVPKKRVPYKKIGFTISAVAAIFLFYIYQSNNNQANMSTMQKQEPYSHEQEAASQEKAVNDEEQPSQNTSLKKEASSSSLEAQDTVTNKKVIENFTIEMESKEYDQSLATIESQIKAAKGYISYSYSYNQEQPMNKDKMNLNSENRFTRLNIKVPKDCVDTFIQQIDDTGRILSKEENNSDITAEYRDIETRVKNLKIQEERLQILLEKADSLTDMLQIEARLSEIGYKLETYANQLKNFDQNVDFATVSLLLTEVTSYQNQSSFTARIQDGWARTITQIKNISTDFIVWLAVNGVYLLVFCLIGWLVYRGIKKKKRIK